MYKGKFKLIRNQLESVIAKTCLTMRLTSQIETKVCYSDPMVLNGKAIAQRIKGTPGITG